MTEKEVCQHFIKITLTERYLVITKQFMGKILLMYNNNDILILKLLLSEHVCVDYIIVLTF